MVEIWKDIRGYEGLYKVSSLGNILSVKRHGSGGNGTGKVLKNKIDKNGYHLVNLYKGGRPTLLRVHRVVASEFITNYENRPYVNHIDFNKGNNRVDNLEWCDQKHNVKHTWDHGRGFNPLHVAGFNNPNTKYDQEVVRHMIELRSRGKSYLQIANIVGCVHSTARRLITQYRQLLEGVNK